MKTLLSSVVTDEDTAVPADITGNKYRLRLVPWSFLVYMKKLFKINKSALSADDSGILYLLVVIRLLVLKCIR